MTLGGDGASERTMTSVAAAQLNASDSGVSETRAPEASGDTDLAGVEAPTVAQIRVPTFGIRYLEQARRQLFARHPEYLPFLVRHLGIHPGMTVVDVGCGTGIYTRVLASRLHGEGQAIGIDLQPALVAHAQRTTESEGWDALIEYRVGDANALPLPDACADIVFCNSLLWLLPDPAAALREMRRVLRPGGRALAAEPDGGLVHSFDPDRPRLSELEQRFQECFVRGSLQLDHHNYEIGRKLPSLFLAAGLVAVRAYPRLFVAAGCDLGEDPQEGLIERAREYEHALAALISEAPSAVAHRASRAKRARAGGMSDEDLAEHERETIAYLRERVEQPARIVSDGAVYMYGGLLCEGMRYDEEPPTTEPTP